MESERERGCCRRSATLCYAALSLVCSVGNHLDFEHRQGEDGLKIPCRCIGGASEHRMAGC